MAKINTKKQAESVLSYPGYYYLPQELLEGDILTPQEQLAELRKLLPVARKRQRRLRSSEFSESYAAQVQLPSLKEIKTDRDISKALSDVALFIRSRRSLVTGAREYRAETVKTLKERFKGAVEVDFEDEGFNWKQFGRYMYDMKRRGKAHEGADSETAVRMFFVAKKVGLTPAGLRDNYDKFLARQDELQQLYENNPFGRRNVSGERMLKRLDELRD